MANFLVFAGTSEGRRLVELLAETGAEVCASVATKYGKELLPAGVKVFAERLDADEMATLLQTLQFACVIDATHPFAREVTENIRAACAFSDTRYLRLSRSFGSVSDCVYVENAQKAAEALAAITGKVLLTTGSKELTPFTSVPDFQQRMYPRVLPMEESLRQCSELGYPEQNIIAMQGPFTREMNCAMMRQIGASVLVTKESGEGSGFAEKLLAAQDVGATTIVIGRPKEEDERGLSFEEITETLSVDYALSYPMARQINTRCFPFFIDLKQKKMLLFGGSSAVARLAETLLGFGTRLGVIAAQFDPQFDSLEFVRIERPYMRGDCAGYHYVFAMTENREVNQAIVQEAKQCGISVYSPDAPGEGDFRLPTVVQRGPLVAGLSICGTDEKQKKQLLIAAREQLEKLPVSEEVPTTDPIAFVERRGELR